MKASPKINLWVIEEKKKAKDFNAMISRLDRSDLEYICHCLLMAREYDGYEGRREDVGTFRKYDIQVGLMIDGIMSGSLYENEGGESKKSRKDGG
jgi:hypothetical protein